MLAGARTLFCLAGVLCAGSAAAQSTMSARVRWQASGDARVVGYRVYSRPLSGSYGSGQDAGRPTPAADSTMSFTVSGLSRSVSYAFAIKGYTSTGVESPFSNEIMMPAQSATTTTSTSTTTTRRPTTTTTRASTTTTTRASTTTTTRTTTTRTTTTARATTTTVRTTTTIRTTTTTQPGAMPSCTVRPQLACHSALDEDAPLVLSRGRLRWTWRSSGMVSVRNFGDPMTDTSFLACVYDGVGTQVATVAPGGAMCGPKPCWRAYGSTGFRYLDRLSLSGGLNRLTLKAGFPGRAKIEVRAGGPNFDMPRLPLAMPVRVQIQQTDSSLCWEAYYRSANTNTDAEFKAKTD